MLQASAFKHSRRPADPPSMRAASSRSSEKCRWTGPNGSRRLVALQVSRRGGRTPPAVDLHRDGASRSARSEPDLDH